MPISLNDSSHPLHPLLPSPSGPCRWHNHHLVGGDGVGTGTHNLSAALSTSPVPGSSTGEGEKGKDTDFGAVMYITAVLIFYSLGIVVMIVKYLKTERKEMEEEMALDHFFKGIPSKRIEHERDAVNRVAIRAFHTLTSGASRADQMLGVAGPSSSSAPSNRGAAASPSPTQDPNSDAASKGSISPNPDDWDPGDCKHVDRSASLALPLPQGERSKYLPRVSLMFRDSRSNGGRRKTAFSHEAENGQVGICLESPDGDDNDGESDQGRGLLCPTSLPPSVSNSSCKVVSENPKQRGFRNRNDGNSAGGKIASSRGGVGVRFDDDKGAGKNRENLRVTKNKPKQWSSSQPSSGNLKKSTPRKDHCDSVPHKDTRHQKHQNPVATDSRISRSMSASRPTGSTHGRVGSPTEVINGSESDVASRGHVTVIVDPSSKNSVSPKRLLVSDV